MDRAEIELRCMAKPGIWVGAALAFIYAVETPPIAPFETVEFFIHQLQEVRREQAFENKMRKWRIVLEGLAQFLHLFWRKKRFIQNFVESKHLAADDGMIRLTLASPGQITLHDYNPIEI